MLTVSFQNWDEVRRRYNPDVIKRALNTTLARTSRAARTQVSRSVREIYNVKARDISARVRSRVQRMGEAQARVLEYRGGPMPLDRFGTRVRSVSTDRGRRVGVSAQVRKDRPRRVIRGAFPLRGRSGPTMRRASDDDGRLPIERAFRLSVPQMINDETVVGVQDFIEKRANIELNRNLDFFQDRMR